MPVITRSMARRLAALEAMSPTTPVTVASGEAETTPPADSTGRTESAHLDSSEGTGTDTEEVESPTSEVSAQPTTPPRTPLPTGAVDTSSLASSLPSPPDTPDSPASPGSTVTELEEPNLWMWICHVCKSRYPMGATIRCLKCGHQRCHEGQNPEKNPVKKVTRSGKVFKPKKPGDTFCRILFWHFHWELRNEVCRFRREQRQQQSHSSPGGVRRYGREMGDVIDSQESSADPDDASVDARMRRLRTGTSSCWHDCDFPGQCYEKMARQIETDLYEEMEAYKSGMDVDEADDTDDPSELENAESPPDPYTDIILQDLGDEKVMEDEEVEEEGAGTDDMSTDSGQKEEGNENWDMEDDDDFGSLSDWSRYGLWWR